MVVKAPNGTPSNPNPDGLIPIRLLPNAGGGFGYGVTRARDLPEGYDRTINMFCHEGQLISPAFAISSILTVPLGTRSPAFLIPWADSSNVPTAVLGEAEDSGADKTTVMTLKNNDATTDTDGITDTIASADFWDDGSGSARIIVGTRDGSKFLYSRTNDATWAAGTQTGIFVARAGDKFYASANDYQIKVWAAGTNPLSAAASSTIQVGTSEAKITALGAIGASPIVFKENGIWSFEDAEQRFVERYRVDHHPDNFPFASPDGAGGLFTADAFGQVIHISQYGAITAIDPLRGKTPGRDTPRGAIRHIVARGDRIYALMRAKYRLVQPSGLKVLKTTDNFGSFTDLTANLTDRSFATVGDISSLDTLANGDAVLVGFDDQFLAVQFIMSTVNTTNTCVLSVALSTGAGTWASATAQDGTASGMGSFAVHTAFGKNGVVALDPATDIGSWVTATYNGSSKYWMRLTVAAALDADTKIAEVSIVLRRAAPDLDTTNHDNAEIWEASGMLPKVLQGRVAGDSVVWNDLYVVPSMGLEGLLAITGLPSPNSVSGALVALLSRGVFAWPLPSTEPHQTSYPALARDASGQYAPVFYPSAVDLGLGYYELRYIECRGRNFTAETDKWRAAFRWDDTNAWMILDDLPQEYAVFEVRGDNRGSVLHTAFQILDGSANDPIGPTGHEIIAWVKLSDVPPGANSQPTRTTPEAS